jgi:murein DD-endopeptidase MepM/ murein hydrolase activator NlpD
MRRKQLVLLLFSMAVLLATAAPIARAQSSNSDRQNELRQEIAEISAEEAAAQQVLADIRARKSVIDARVAELDAQLSDATARAAAMDAEVARLTIVLSEAEVKLARAEVQLEAAKREVRRSAEYIYRSARRGAAYDYLTVERPDDLVHATEYLDKVNARQRDTLDSIRVLRDEVAAQRQIVVDSKAQADEAALGAQRARDDIARTRSEVEPARAEAAAQADAEAAQVAALAARRSDAQRELDAVSAAIAEQLRRAFATSGGGQIASAPPPGGCDARPVAGRMSSGYGPRGGGMHSGLDIAAPTGTPIYACWSGRVLIAGWQGGYGNAVVIDHGGGRATLYGHQSVIAASVGQTVGAGTLIGYVGSTGNSTGPHLHFEVRINGNPVDPSPYF